MSPARALARVGFSDLRRVFDEDGRLKPIYEWDEGTAAAISSVKVRADGEGSTVTEIKLWDKNSALEKLGKHLGMFTERPDDNDLPPVRRVTDLTESEVITRLLDHRARRAKWLDAKSKDERKAG